MRARIPRILASIAAVGALGAAALPAQAGGNVSWSIGINLPPVATVITNAPRVVYAPPPVVYAPPPVIYQPAPVYYHPPPVVVHQPPRVIYAPPPQVVYHSGWAPPGHKRKWKDRDRDGIDDRWDRWDDRRGRGW
jgi:hypothetical protein